MIIAMRTVPAFAHIRVAVWARVFRNAFDRRITVRADDLTFNVAAQAMRRKEPIDCVPHPILQNQLHNAKPYQEASVFW